MIETVETCQQVWAKPYKEAEAWKAETKGKVIGWFPMYIPEELIYAAGALPLYLHPIHENVTLANRYLLHFCCPPLRMVLDSLMKQYYSVVDGLLLHRVCDEAMHVAELMDMAGLKKWVHLFRTPYTMYRPVWQDMVRKQIDKLRGHLEDLLRHRITEASLRESIATYNSNRAMLRQLYDFRRKNPGFFSNIEVLAIVGSSMLMPKKKHNELLKKLLAELDGKKAQGKGPRVVLTGSICDDPMESTLRTVEEAGLAVVDDEMYIGGRYFESDVSTNGSAFEALARYQWEKIPCVSRFSTDRTYEDYLLDLVKRSGAQGVVDFHWKFCPMQVWERPFTKECLNKAGIPYIVIDLSEEAQALEALRTRLEAFSETIKGVK